MVKARCKALDRRMRESWKRKAMSVDRGEAESRQRAYHSHIAAWNQERNHEVSVRTKRKAKGDLKSNRLFDVVSL